MKLILNNCDFVIRKFDTGIEPKEIYGGVYTSEGKFIEGNTNGYCYKYDVKNINKVSIAYEVVTVSSAISARTEFASIRNGAVQQCEDHKVITSNEIKSRIIDVSTCDELYVNVWDGATNTPKVKAIDGEEYNILEGVTESGYYSKSGKFNSSASFFCKKYDVSSYSNIDAIGSGIVSNGVPCVVLLDSSNNVVSTLDYDADAVGRTTTRLTIDVSGATSLIINSLIKIEPTALETLPL